MSEACEKRRGVLKTAVTGVKRVGNGLEVVKGSRFVRGKMALKTHGKTCVFYAKSGKKIQMRANMNKYAHQRGLFEKNVSRKKVLIVGLGAVMGNWTRGVVNVSRFNGLIVDGSLLRSRPGAGLIYRKN